MTKAYLKFPSRNIRYAPETMSRRLAFKNFKSMSFRSGASAQGEEEEEEEDEEGEKALLLKIQGRVTAEVEKSLKTEKNKKLIEQAATQALSIALQGLNMEALKKFDDKFDPVKIIQSVKDQAIELEKLKNAPVAGASQKQALKELLMKPETMDAIKEAYESKNPLKTVNLTVQAAVAAMTTGNVVTDGDIPEDILNSFSVEAFVPKRRPKEYVFNFVMRRTVAKISEYKTWLEEGNEEGAFAIVAEGGLKPLVSKTLVRNTAKYRKIAGKRVYTEEFVKFRQEAYNIIEDLFNDQLMRNYQAIIVTDLIADAALYVSTTLDNQYANPTDYHAIGAAAAQIEALDFVPDLLVLNGQDKWRIGLSQDAEGRFYTSVPMYNPNGEVTMLGFRVITSNRIPAGYFLLGESGLFKVEDEPVTVRIGYGINVTTNGEGLVTAVESDVDHNRFRIISELFFHDWLSTNHVGSFVYGNFADIKEILDSAA